MAGRKTFTAGEVLQAADVNDFLMDQSVMVFAGTAARGSAIPSPSEGMVTYLSDADELQVFDGSSFTAVGVQPAILQVVSTTKTDTFSTTSTSYVDITGFSLTITPSSSANKVLVMANPSLGASTGNEISLVIDRGGTDISVSSTSNTGVTFPRSEFGIDEASILFLDSPASAAAVTYKLQMKVSTGTGFLNRRGVNANIIATSTMMLMEVAG